MNYCFTSLASDTNPCFDSHSPLSPVKNLITNFLHRILAVNTHRLNKTALFLVLLHLCCSGSWGHQRYIPKDLVEKWKITVQEESQEDTSRCRVQEKEERAMCGPIAGNQQHAHLREQGAFASLAWSQPYRWHMQPRTLEKQDHWSYVEFVHTEFVYKCFKITKLNACRGRGATSEPDPTSCSLCPHFNVLHKVENDSLWDFYSKF